MMTDMLNPLSTSFDFHVKQRLGKVENPSFITEWFHNTETAAYL